VLRDETVYFLRLYDIAIQCQRNMYISDRRTYVTRPIKKHEE